MHFKAVSARIALASVIAIGLGACAGPARLLYEFSPPINPHVDAADQSGQAHEREDIDPRGLEVVLLPTATSIGVTIHNNSTDSVGILWEHCVYIDSAGRGHRGVVHGFDPLAGPPQIPAPTLVLPDSSFAGSMLPLDHVIYVPVRGIDTWIPISILPSHKSKVELEEAQSYMGRKIGVVLALDRGNRIEGWHYEFEILSVAVEDSNKL